MIGDIFQPTHLIFIFVVALLVLGPKRLPEVGRSLGKGIRDFRGAMSGIEEHAHGAFDMSEPQAPPPEPPMPTELSAPEVAAQPTVSSAVAVSSPPASPVASVVAVAPSVAGSGSGSPEPHPDEYAD
ncbi:MAG TPA: twin-arginine translocase TatA/TatE family subunit [Solirubrobacteraceae bacterium]